MKPLMTFLLENLDSPQETKVLLDKNVIVLEGAVPGANNSYLNIRN